MYQAENFDQWRNIARQLLIAAVPPSETTWQSASGAQNPLFDTPPLSAETPSDAIRLPRKFITIAQSVALHSSPERWSLLYRVAWRLSRGEHHLLEIDIDPDIAALSKMQHAVEKDAYRMRQFVRFRKVDTSEGEQFVAWYEPEHNTLESNGKFFVDRFGSLRWAILTPALSLVWNLNELETAPGVPRSRAPQEDEMEDLWRLYYSAIYNPARMKLNAMRAQLPVSRWNNLPEARLIPDLVRLSRGRVQEMAEAQPRSAAQWIPQGADLAGLRAALPSCRACGICASATQPVWGEGDPHSKLVLIGEQPGDEEDRAGRPFVGPAGEVLDQAMRESGLDRSDIYVTNAVKAFKFEERGKRRIHQNPRPGEISACRPWLIAELERVQPKTILCLGATAAQSVLGRKVQISIERSKAHRQGNVEVFVTYHPSSILRAPDPIQQDQLTILLTADLTQARLAAGLTGPSRFNALR